MKDQALYTVTLATTSMFAGIAFHVGVSEHSSRIKFIEHSDVSMDDSLPPHSSSAIAKRVIAMMEQWKLSYSRTIAYQIPLAIASTSFSAILYRRTGGPEWLMSSLLIGSVLPFTLFGMFPLNKQMRTAEIVSSHSETHPATDTKPERVTYPTAIGWFKKWGTMHNYRVVAGLAAVALMIVPVFFDTTTVVIADENM